MPQHPLMSNHPGGAEQHKPIPCPIHGRTGNTNYYTFFSLPQIASVRNGFTVDGLIEAHHCAHRGPFPMFVGLRCGRALHAALYYALFIPERPPSLQSCSEKDLLRHQRI